METVKNHFDECPYGCNSKGMLLDSELGRMILCPYCSKKKSQLLSKGKAIIEESDSVVDLSTIFGINSRYLSTKFVYESVIPDGETVFIEDESLKWQKECSEKLYLDLSTGTLPESSLCFGISVKGRVDMFCYPIMAKAYLASLSVAKLISCSEYGRLVIRDSDGVDKYFESDFVMMLVNDGSTLADLASAKGLMQTRGLRGKPTVFVTTWTIEACSGLLSSRGDESLLLAKPIFVEYKKGKNKHSNYINNLLGVENKRVGSSDMNISEL